MTSFGETLRRERELRGVSLREIADATKISVRFLQALEQDRLEILPGGMFRRAFVREYARFLGLDAERLVAEFVYAHSPEGVEAAEKREARGGAHAGPHTGAWVLAVFAVVLVPLLGAKVWREHGRAVPAPAPPPPVQVERVYATPAPQPADETPRDGIALTLSAKERCWVAVRADGRTVLDRVLTEGESETVQAQGEIVLSVGNAGGISFRVDDRPGLPLGRSGEVRRNIVITRENLPSLVQDAPPPVSAHSS